jgi:hypothetical protein
MPVLSSTSNTDPNPFVSPGSPSLTDYGFVAALYTATATPSARLLLCGAVILAGALLGCLSLLRRPSPSQEAALLPGSASGSHGGDMAKARRDKPRTGNPADGAVGLTDKKDAAAAAAAPAAPVRPPQSRPSSNVPDSSIGQEDRDDDGSTTTETGGTTTGAGPGAEAPSRRRSYTKVVDGVGVELQEEIVAAEGWKRHTRVYGGGVCLACLENERDRRRML